MQTPPRIIKRVSAAKPSSVPCRDMLGPNSGLGRQCMLPSWSGVFGLSAEYEGASLLGEGVGKDVDLGCAEESREPGCLAEERLVHCTVRTPSWTMRMASCRSWCTTSELASKQMTRPGSTCMRLHFLKLISACAVRLTVAATPPSLGHASWMSFGASSGQWVNKPARNRSSWCARPLGGWPACWARISSPTCGWARFN